MEVPKSAEAALLRLHETVEMRPMAEGLARVVETLMPLRALAVVLRPFDFAASLLVCPPAHRSLFEGWLREHHKKDVWMRRSPPRPADRVVRHTDHTPDRVLAASSFYRRVMKPRGIRYGAALLFWAGRRCQAIAFLVRSQPMGDFLDPEMELLRRLHPHLQTAVRRVFALHEDRSAGLSLVRFIGSLPTAMVLLNSRLQVVVHNRAAVELCHCWRHGPAAATGLAPSRRFQVPSALLRRIRQRYPDFPYLKDSPGAGFDIVHPRHPKLRCHVSFIQRDNLEVAGPMCLLRLTHGADPVETVLASGGAGWRALAELSPAERTVVAHLARGLTNSGIARALGKSTATVRNQLHDVYRKLGVRSRSELLTMVLTDPQ